MLLPALNKARAKARAIACVNNLKQNYLAARMYMDDSNDYFYSGSDAPYNAEVTGAKENMSWAQKLVYLGYAKDVKSLSCPLASNTSSFWLTYGAPVSASSDYLLNLKKAIAGTALYGNSTETSSPTSTIIIADNTKSGPEFNFRLYYYDTTAGSLYLAHDGKANAAFLDGHVGTMDENQLQDAATLTYENSATQVAYIQYYYNSEGTRFAVSRD